MSAKDDVSKRLVHQEDFDDDDRRLPPRRVLHAKDYTKVTKWFQASLLVLLILLTVGIMVYYQFYEL